MAVAAVEEDERFKDLLSEIPKCKVNEFKGEHEHDSEEAVLTEPNDSAFRVRRLSRSFSIPSSKNCEEIFLASQPLPPSNDENIERENGAQSSNQKSKFILLKRSRSLGHIFLPDLPTLPSAKPSTENAETVENLTEKVEALEIEVLPEVHNDFEDEKQEEKVDSTTINLVSELRNQIPMINRPQTSPPILYPSASLKQESSDESSSKLSILDKMQKSLGFFFKCARKDDNGEEEYLKYPQRSKTPDYKSERMRLRAPIIKSATTSTINTEVKISRAAALNDNVPMQANDFITKVDESPKSGTSAIKKIPTFYDIPGPKGPLLQPQCPLSEVKKCLVLDLDETLVHSSFHVPEAHDLVVTLGLPDGSSQNIYVAKRPGVDEFLARMSESFEIVIFTASLAHYADPVIDFLTVGMNQHLKEPRGIKLRLYRESCLFLRGLYVKDLSRLGRKLEHTVIVDNSPASFLLQPDHGIPIKSWFSDTSDRELDTLHDTLMHLVDSESVSEWRLKLSSL